MNKPAEIDASAVMAKDVVAFERALKSGNLTRNSLRRFEQSADCVAERQARLPRIHYDRKLPIAEHLPGIEELLRQHQVIIVAGETGSGKTTQLPLACLRAGLGIRGMIAHTQPRRLAARAVAHRIAYQMKVSLGKEVGYAVRFDEKWNDSTYVKVMTDGLLLTEIRSDRYLNAYDCVIIDEAHERSLNVDFLIGYLRRLVVKRPNIKVIITSATIDVKSFSEHFDNAPIVSVEGRSYPVEVRYRPVAQEPEETVLEVLQEIQAERRESPNDILMFLASEREILEWSLAVRKHFGQSLEVLPLYARLPQRDQERIFAPSGKQRLLLSTNVAETSLTVPNIRYVVDLGTARISRYSSRSRVQRLPIEQISQASANQRAGRCGRLTNGICYRIYEEQEFHDASRYTEPEIKRTNLASVLLQAMYFRFGSFEDFPFLDPPESHAVRDAARLLEELGATEGDRLTKIGRTMARLPIDPRMARMMIEASSRGSLREVLIIVSALTAQDPRLRPLDRQSAADEAHKQFAVERSDFMSFLKLWDWIEQLRQDASSNSFKRQLERKYVSVSRFFEWRSLHRQLLIACQRAGLKVNRQPASFRDIHTALLIGSLRTVGHNTERDEYAGPRNTKFRLFPGSVLNRKNPKWVMAADIVETSQTFARCVAEINPGWIVNVAESLLNYSYHDPFYDQKRGEAMVLSDATLSGLPVLANKPVRLALHDAEKARALFVQHAFVNSKETTKWPFLSNNLKLRRQIEYQQDRERRRDLVVSTANQTRFYLERLDSKIVNLRTFERWYKNAKASERSTLYMSEHDLRLRPDDPETDTAFPTRLSVFDDSFDLTYRFAPGEPDDGVSVNVRTDRLHLLNSHVLDWHVPGFLNRKCLALLKSLPKAKRKMLMPLQECSDICTRVLLDCDHESREDLLVELSGAIRREFRVGIDAGDWNLESLEPVLFMNVRLIDDSNKLVDQDRDLGALQGRHAEWLSNRMEEENVQGLASIELTEYPIEGVPESQIVKSRKGSFRVYPTLIDQQTHVDLTYLPQNDRYFERNIRGVSRLVLFQENDSVRYIKREVRNDEQLTLHFASLGSPSELADQVLIASVYRGYFAEQELPRSRDDLEAMVASRRGELVRVSMSVIDLAKDILSQRFDNALGIDTLKSDAFEPSKQDLQEHLSRLVGKTFLLDHSFERLKDVSRYLNAMHVRIENLPGRVLRDRQLIEEVHDWEQRLELIAGESPNRRDCLSLRYLLEEYRISLFTQQIRTRGKVSRKILKQEFEKFLLELPKN